MHLTEDFPISCRLIRKTFRDEQKMNPNSARNTWKLLARTRTEPEPDPIPTVIQPQFARRRSWQGQWGGYEDCGSRHECSTLLRNGPVQWWLFPTLLLQHPSQNQQADPRVWCVMSVFCEVTRCVGDSWATSPTLLRDICVRSTRARVGFRCCICV